MAKFVLPQYIRSFRFRFIDPAVYDHLRELHPPVVQPDHQRPGIGSALVDIEQQVAAHGRLTVILASDDEDGMTWHSGVSRYDNLPEKPANI